MSCLYIHNGIYYTEKQLLEKFNSHSQRTSTAREWLLSKTNMNLNELSIVNGLLSNDSLGRMLEDGKIIISNLAPDSVIYHEAFHRIFNFFATDKDRLTLINEFNQRKDASKLIDEMDKVYNSPEKIKIRGTVLSKEDLIEEILAEEFSVYKIEKSIENPIKKSIFDKILDFLLKTLNLGKKLDNKTFAIQFYEKINEGFFASSPILQTKLSNYKDSLANVKEIDLGIEKTLDIVYSIHRNIINHVLKNDLFYDLIDNTLTEDLFKEGFKSVHNSITDNDIKSGMRKNINTLRANYYALLKEYKIEKGEELEQYNDALFADGKSKDSEFNKNSIEFDPRTSQRQAIRIFLSALTTNKQNSIGQPEIVPVKQVVDLLLNNLSNVPPTLEDFSYILNKLAITHPYVSQIVNILQLKAEKGDSRFINDFIASFNNAFVNFDLLTSIVGNLEIASANDLASRDQVISTWKQNLIDNINTSDNLISELQQAKLTNDRDAKKFFKLLGIDLNSDYKKLTGYAKVIQKIIINKAKEKNPVTTDQLLTIFNFKKDNNFFVGKELETSFNVISFLSDFVKQEKNNMDDISIMLFNAENKPIYPVTQYHYLSMVTNWMNYYKERFYDEELDISLKDYLNSKMPYLFNFNTESSYWLKSFLYNPGKIDLTLMTGINIGIELKSDFSNVGDYDYYTVGLKLFESSEALRYSKTIGLTQGDRQISPIFQVKDIVDDKNKYAIFQGYVKSEIKRLHLNKLDGLQYMQGFNSDKGNSLLSKDIVNINSLFNKLKITGTIDDAIDDLLLNENINTKLDDYIDKQTQKYLDKFYDLQIQIPKGTYSSQEEFVKNWYTNTYFNNIEQFKLFYGDSSIFKTYANLWKRLNTSTSTGTPSIVSEELLEELNALDDAYTFEGFNYKQNREKNGASKNTIKEQFLSDLETESSNIEFIENKFREYYTNIYNVIPWKDKFTSIFGNETPNLQKLIEEEVKRDASAYKNIKETDGLSYINLFEWRRVMKTFSMWSPKYDNLFNQEFEVLKVSMDNRFTKQEKETKFNEIMSNGYLTLDDYFDDFAQASLLKPQYSGTVYYKTYEDYINTPIGERANIYGIRKTSFMPLLPSVIFGTNLETIHHKMLNSGTGITFYNSAAKDGKSNISHDINDLTDKEENQLETLNGDFSTYLDYQFLKNQLYINPEEKSKIIDSTQSRKQLITDKYHKNIPFDFIFNNTELGFTGITNKWNSLSDIGKEQQSDIHKSVNEYILFTNKILERNKNFLLKEFEIASNQNLTEFEFENINKVLKLLKQAAIDRNNSLDIIDSFQYLLENNESTLFNVFPNTTKLQSLLTSIVTNNVIKSKRLGNDYAQVSPVMWETKGENRKNIKKTNNELLKTYNDLTASEIMIPAPKDMLKKIEKLIIKEDPEILISYNKFKDKYSTMNVKLLVDILNDLIERKYLDSEVTLKGLRIPNQELSSKDVFKIKRFLLPTMSKFVVINAELVAKTGSDFDIDKLNLYFKYTNNKLKEIVYSEDNSEEAIKERFDSFKQQELESLLAFFTNQNIEQISQKLKEIKENKKEIYDINKKDLEDLFSKQEISLELKEIFFNKLNYELDEQLEEIITYNNTDFFNLKLNSEQLENISKVTNLFEYRNELYKIRQEKLRGVSATFYNLLDEKDKLNKELNIAFERLSDKKNPFKNLSFKDLHSTYLQKKKDVENFLESLPNGYPEVNTVIQQIHQRIENVEIFYNDWRQAKITKNNLNEELIDSYFSEMKSLKIEEKSLKDLEYELFKTLPIGEQNSIGAIFNKLSEIEQKLILSPLSVANLLHPILDGGLEALLVDKLEKNVPKDERFSIRETRELSEAVEPENNLSKKNDMKEANIGIAQMATHGTGHSISKNTELSSSFFSAMYNVNLSTEILFEGFNKNNDFSSAFTNDAESIAQLISGHLTSQVDAASNPYAAYLNIRSNVNPISMYLLRRGVPKQVIYSFLMQPSILQYLNRRDIYMSPVFKHLNPKKNKKSRDILVINDLKNLIGSAITKDSDTILKKEHIVTNILNLKSINLKDLMSKSSREDKDFQKNALFYFLSLKEQASLFSDYKKLMSSDTDYHKSLNSYQELQSIYIKLKQANFIGNLDEMLNSGFIGGFTKAAKLYYFPWKNLFLGHRDFASHTNSYLTSYTNILANNLGFSRSEERKVKLKDSLEKQLLVYILDNYFNNSALDPIEVLEFGSKSIKQLNLKKIFSIDKDYGIVGFKRDIIKSKAKSFNTYELNNYLMLMQKINSLEAIKIKDDTITGKEFLRQLYIQSLKQSKNDFSPNDISNVIPGRIKIELLTEIINKFLEMEKQGLINSTFFANFIVQFQLNNDKFILSSPVGHLLGKDEEGNIIDSQLIQYKLKGNFYTSNFDAFNAEIVEDTKIIEDVKQKIEELNTIDITDNKVKNLYFSDVSSKDTVNGKKSFINKTKINFENSNVYLIPQNVFIDGMLNSISKIKIGTFENDELGNFHLKIDLSENISQQTTEQPINKEIKPNEVKGENITSKGSEFAKKLTNVGNSVGITYKGKEYVNSEHAYQTWKSGEFNQAGYDLKGGKVRGGKIGDTFSIMTDILTEKLKQHPDLVQGINERGGLEYLQKSTHNVIGDKFWESTGQNKFIEALVQTYKNINTEVNNNKVDLNKKRGDIIEFQQETYQVERVTKEGFDVRNINTGEVDFISIEDYIDETQEQSIVEENNQEITKEDTDKLPPCIG